MKVFLFLLSVCGLVVLSTADKKCDKLVKKFEDCLSKGYKPKTLEGCKVGDGKLDKKQLKKCGKFEKNAIKKCNYSCKDDKDDGGDKDDKDDDGDKAKPFVPAAGGQYQLKKVDGPANGHVVSYSSSNRRSHYSWWANLTPEAGKGTRFTVGKSSCDCDANKCNCFRFTFRARVSCCQSWDLALSCHGNKRPNGNGRVMVHKSPWRAEDECWCVEPAVGGYKLKKAHGHEKGKYLVAGEARDGSTFWVDLASSDDASVWSIEKV